MNTYKDKLFRDGYITFNLKETFPEYIPQLDFIKNKIQNGNSWKLYISSVLTKEEQYKFELFIIENYGNQVNWDNTKFHVHEGNSNAIGYEITINCDTWEIADNIQEKIRELIDPSHINQYWFYQDYHFNSMEESDLDFISNVETLFDGIFDKFYEGGYSKGSESTFNLTNFRKDCHIHSHQDGQNESRICGMLFYLNPNFNKDTGGNLILGDELEIPAEYGNVTILDYTKNNIQHEVSKVTEDKNRFTLLKFFEKKSII